MKIDPQITHTYIGREYGWDRVSDAEPALLRNNREASMRVLLNPDEFPNADFDACELNVVEIDKFFAEHGAIMGQFA